MSSGAADFSHLVTGTRQLTTQPVPLSLCLARCRRRCIEGTLLRLEHSPQPLVSRGTSHRLDLGRGRELCLAAGRLDLDLLTLRESPVLCRMPFLSTSQFCSMHLLRADHGRCMSLLGLS